MISKQQGRTWGDWKLDTESHTLDLYMNGGILYSVQLTGITDSAQMLDWIIQLREKTWITNDHIGDLVSALDHIFDPQATICRGGQHRTIDPMRALNMFYASDPDDDHIWTRMVKPPA
ncbi:MAG: hypothetical protein J0G35_11210 [Acidobacteriales bacterium]|nr:hypothetical protein [Terriglobales bacterium]